MKKIGIFILLLCLLLCGCAERKKTSRSLFCMDTVMSIEAYGKNGAEALDEAEKELKRLEKLFDRNNRESDVYKLNNRITDKAEPETEEVIDKALSAAADTDGAFDITVAPVMDLWGFYDKHYRVPDDESIKNALKSVDYRNVFKSGNGFVLTNNAKLDLGGIAKGYASSVTADILHRKGVKSAMINLGGNVYAMGKQPNGKKWHVAIADPDGGSYAAALYAENEAVVTSGDYQRYFEENGKKYHHIINPETGYPANGKIRSVTVICADAARADAYSTALFVMGMDKAKDFLRKHTDIGAVIISDDKTVYYAVSQEHEISFSDGVRAVKLERE